MRQFIVASLTVLIISANAQTATVVNGAGQTIVEVTTTGPAGILITSIIQTLTSSGTSPGTSPTTSPTASTTTTKSPTTTSLVTVTPGAITQGPVGQPAATEGTAGGITPFTYTTIINGVTTVIADYFTPSFPATIPPTVGPAGTVLDYSSWLSIYGATSTKSASTGVRAGTLDPGWWWCLLSCLASGMGGIWLLVWT